MSGFFRRTITLLTERYKLKPARNCTGKDLEGNSYYEIPAQNYFFGLKYFSKNHRFVEPKTDIGTRSSFKVTPEWDSWLRKRRNDPPTLEELENNVQKANLIQQRVQMLEEKNKEEKIKQKTLIQNKNIKNEQSDVESWETKS